MELEASLAANRDNWNERVAAHAASGDYAVDSFASDPDRISPVVAFDRPRMGEVTGLRLVHLQCHIGTDTLSWARLGATVTGVDFSGPALEVARDLAGHMGHDDARFIEATVSDAPRALAGERYDVVYTGVGALCWLPSIDRWAQVVADLLAPGGRLFLREGHPMLWALDHDRTDDALVVATPYFEREQPVRFDEGGTYVDVGPDVTFQHTVTYEWNHGIGEVVGALLERGLVLEHLEEHRSVPWRPWEVFEPSEEHAGEWVLPTAQRDLVPLTYTLVARRPADGSARG